jgi:hypothetical protein
MMARIALYEKSTICRLNAVTSSAAVMARTALLRYVR